LHYSRGLVRDLESKGIIRTTVESLNLSLNANKTDVLSAECIRTFPTATFPANALLRREEVETLKTPGISVIAAVYHNKGEGRKTFTDPPFDLMYGFRGNKRVVDLLSPFEMLMYWEMERVLPPTRQAVDPSSTLTGAGERYRRNLNKGEQPSWEPGIHYLAKDTVDRILLPDIPALKGLRHRWFWQRRSRPFVPVWSYAKVPRATLSPEENGRLLSVYMRPWTLNPHDATETTPLLSRLQMSKSVRKSPAAPDDAASQVQPAPKRRKTKKGPPAEQDEQLGRRSYATAWREYIDGNVVSETSRRFITNLLMATAARVVEDDEDDLSEDSDDFDRESLKQPVGSLALIQKTLDGIASRSQDDGAEGFGRYAQVISLGKALWQSASLTSEEKRQAKERRFDEEALFPPPQTVIKSVKELLKKEDERLAPYEARTKPSAQSSKMEYGSLIDDWYKKLHTEDERPNELQLGALKSIGKRVLTEIELEKEGTELRHRVTRKKEEETREEPMRGYIHGLPGTGKSRLIQWICRMFKEVRVLYHINCIQHLQCPLPHNINTWHRGCGSPDV
jgi:hypothetical protein